MTDILGNRTIPINLTIEVLYDDMIEGQSLARIKLNDITIFSEIVYDIYENKAERNILLLFAERLRKLVEDPHD